MLKTIGMTLLVVVITVVVCQMAIAEAVTSIPDSSASDSKFCLRIIKKQDSLTSMAQCIDRLQTVQKNKNIQDDEAILKELEKIEEEIDSSSDAKYVNRLERKISALVKESFDQIECTKHFSAQPAVPGNLTPKSTFNDMETSKEHAKPVEKE